MTPADEVIANTLRTPVPPEITAMAGHAMSLHRDVRAVLAYGSCLRGVSTSDSLIDLYVLTADISGVSSNAISRMACALVPPNVYYLELELKGQLFRAKYAVLPLPQFARWMTAGNPYFWARFSQPSALVYAADDQASRQAHAAVLQAATTMFAHARSLCGPGIDHLQVWTAGFRATYRTELRAESGGSRAHHVVEANAGYYQALSEALASTPPRQAHWLAKTIAGKCWAAARLVKASFTFTGGADYVVWKIERHTGQKIRLSAWQRRHPVIAGVLLLPRLLISRAVR